MWWIARWSLLVCAGCGRIGFAPEAISSSDGSPAVDAGPRRDAGRVDAATLPDAAFDASSFDASSFDAGSFDAAMFASDAGVFDAGDSYLCSGMGCPACPDLGRCSYYCTGPCDVRCLPCSTCTVVCLRPPCTMSCSRDATCSMSCPGPCPGGATTCSSTGGADPVCDTAGCCVIP